MSQSPPSLTPLLPFDGGTARFTPAWVRWSVTGVVAVMFLGAAGMLVASALFEGRHDWVAPSAALAETAGTGMLVVLVLFFLDQRRDLLRTGNLTASFFLQDVPRALRNVDYDPPPFTEWQEGGSHATALRSNVALRIAYARGVTSTDYILTVGGESVAIMVTCNVMRLGVTCILPTEAGETAASVYSGLADTLKGAENAGYHIGTAYDLHEPRFAAALSTTRCAAQTLHRNLSEDFLQDPLKRQFVVQDLAIMIRALIEERRRTRPTGRHAAQNENESQP